MSNGTVIMPSPQPEDSCNGQLQSEKFWLSLMQGNKSIVFPSLPHGSSPERHPDMVVEESVMLRAGRSHLDVRVLVTAAWAVATRSYTGVSDVVVGSLFTAPDLRDPKSATAMPIRLAVEHETQVPDFMNCVRLRIEACGRYSSLGLERLSNLGVECRNACAFQTVLIDGEHGVNGAPNHPISLDRLHSRALNITYSVHNRQLLLQGAFDSHIMPKWLAGRVIRQLGHIAGQLADSRRLRIADIICDPNPRDLEDMWKLNWEITEEPKAPVHQLIAENAQRRPQAAAIDAWDGSLSYSELDELSTCLAHVLRERGVTRNSMVPFCLDRSMVIPVVILAILKCGCAYVPIDPATPAGRCARILQHSRASIAIASPSVAEDYFGTTPTIRLSTEDVVHLASSLQNRAALQEPVGVGSVACVLFTSGSTGVPKGVVIEHRAICTSMGVICKTMPVTEDSRVLHFASEAFDVTIFEVLGTLLSGGCVCIPNEKDRLAALPEYVVAANVNTLGFVASVARLYDPSMMPGVHTMFIGGERLTQGDVQKWSKVPRLFNVCGPTEAVFVCAVNHITSSETSPALVGRLEKEPIWVVDPDDHNILVPFGAPGELVVEGLTLSRGYLDNEELTNDVYIENPAWLLRGGGPSLPGRRGRIYKTGDLVYYDEHGQLIYVGRKASDNQVKIRGNRIELGEVESVVLECLPSTAEAVVDIFQASSSTSSAGGGSEGNNQLAVFICYTGQSESTSAQIDVLSPPKEMARQLSGKLPPYMVPSYFFSVAEMPRTITSKVDRLQLKALAQHFVAERRLTAGSTQHIRAPNSTASRGLRDVWAQVLQLSPDSIGLDDNFIKLGGDSIQAISLVRKARQSLRLRLSVAEVLRAPSLEALASVAVLIEADTDELSPFSTLPGHIDVAELRKELSESLGLSNTSRIEDVYACTPLQEGLLSISSRHTGTYTLQRVLELNPGVDVEALQDAWQAMVKFTPIMRTRIMHHSELGLVQVVVDESIKWTMVHPRDLESFLATDRDTPMELDQPLVRYAITSPGGDSPTTSPNKPRQLIWTIHHAVYDGWCLPLIVDRIRDAYRGKTFGRSEFAPFVKWMRQDVDAAATEAHWTSYLDGCNESALFPPLPPAVTEPVADSTAETKWLLPDRRLTAEVTTSTVLRAAWAIVTGRYTSSEDVMYATTMSGRSAPVAGIESIIGPAIATVPTRFRLDSGKTVGQFLNECHQDAITAIPYEQTGLQRISKINAECRKVMDIQSFLIVQPAEYDQPEFEGFGRWVTGMGYYRLDVAAIALECIISSKNSVRIAAYFDSRVLSSTRVNKLLSQFTYVCHQLVTAGPATTLAEVELLLPPDLKSIWAWNGPLLPHDPESQLAHEDIRNKALARPHAPAVDGWDGGFTYAQFDQISTRLAKKLVGVISVRPCDIVPLYFEPSVWVVVAMVAVLKAGASFVPMDASQPAARRDQILSQLPPKIILASAKHAATTPFGPGWTAVEVSQQQHESECEDTKDMTVLPGIDPSSTAWIIFTSGSTGLPKGAMLQHSAVQASHRKLGATFGFNPDTRMLQFASFAFDVCVLEIVATLMHGGCVCIPSEADSRSLSGIPEACAALRVNTMILTPTVARLFKPSDFPQLSTLVLTGEALVKSDVARWSTVAYLANGYGPAECTNICTVHQITAGDDSDPNKIGSLPGVPNWVVHSHNHNMLAPIGGVGELVIEGVTVGQGYLNDSVKSAAAFIRDPAWLTRGLPEQRQFGRSGRLYKTGDLVQLNEDGSLTYIGRKDFQIKIRGQRIEPGEVEHHVMRCTGAVEAFVDVVKGLTVREGGGGGVGSGDQGKILTAFIRRPGEASSPKICHDSDKIMALLAEAVPAYMIPTIFIDMPSMPRTPSGKTDRKALHSIAADLARELSSTRALDKTATKKRLPVTEAEKTLQRLWAKVLGSDPKTEIGLDDGFLSLGGDSLAAMKLVSLAKRSGLTLSIPDILFRHRSLEDQARNATLNARYDSEAKTAPFSLLPPDTDVPALCADVALSCNIEESMVEDIYPCTPSQEGLLSITSKLAGHTAYVLQHVFDLPATVDVPRIRAAWEATVRTTDILRTRITHHSNHGLLQVVTKDVLAWTEPARVDEYIDADKKEPMGLDTPLVRFAIATDGPGGRTRLIWTIHHALADGFTLELVRKKAERLYRASNNNMGEIMHSPPSEFRGFVRYLIEGDKEAMTGYWRRAMAGVHPTTFPELPASVRDPVEDAEEILQYRFPDRVASSTSTTLATLLRTAWAIVQSRYTSTDDVVFGEVFSGRGAPVPSIENIMGLIMVTVPMRVRVGASQSVRQLLDDVHAGTIQTMQNEQLGLHRISRVSPDCQAACAFQTLFVNQPPGGIVDVDENENETPIENEGEDRQHLLAAMPDYRLASYALCIECTPTIDSKGFQARARFDSRVLTSAAARRILEQFCHVAEQLAVVAASSSSSGNVPLSSITVHTPRDLRDMWAWNDAPVQQSDEKLLLHEVYRDRVRAAPQSMAVCAWDGEYSYARLDELSDRLAAVLMSKGIGGASNPQQLVPLCFEKTRWVVVAMMAVLKTGAGIVPLDAAHPAGRHDKVLAQLGDPGLVLVSSQNAERKFRPGWSVLVVSEASLESISTADAFEPPQISPSAVCWVLFTSGSTGEPKGVVLEHSAVRTSYRLLVDALHVNSATRMVQFSSYAWDVATFEIFAVLISGGCVCIPSEAQRLEALPEFCTTFDVNTAILTPSLTRLHRPEDLHTIRVLILTGESPTRKDLLRWRHRVAVLINGYGPAEAAQISNVHRVDPYESNPLPSRIGRLRGVPVWLTQPDDPNTLVPVGAVGELLIEGYTLARGYLSATQTAAAFIRDPEWLLQGASTRRPGTNGRLYRTGDLARYAEDGALVYMGRKDSQVKIRGQRTELGEIEYNVNQCIPQASEVVVETASLKHDAGNMTLVAFLKMSDAVGPDKDSDHVRVVDLTEDVEQQLKELLPPFMMPSVFLAVHEMPKAATGKMDRVRLKQLAAKHAEEVFTARTQSSKRPPSTMMECKIQALWAKVLRVEAGSIGADTDFFEVGGDSISALKLVGEARRAEVKLTVADVFNNSKLESLASLAARPKPFSGPPPTPQPQEASPSRFQLIPEGAHVQTVVADVAALCGIWSEQVEDVYPCTPLQEGLLTLTTRHANTYIAQVAIELLPSTNVSAFQAAWEKMVESTPILRTRIVQHPQLGFLQVVVDEDFTWLRHHNFEQAVEEAKSMAMHPGGPLSRYSFVEDVSTSSSRLVWTVHHALYDPLTARHILDQLDNMYDGSRTEKPPPYAAFVEHVQISRSPAAQDFWRTTLEGNSAATFPALPPHVSQPSEDTVITQNYQIDTKPTGITAGNMLTAAWAIVASWHTNSSDVVFGAVRSGRMAPVDSVEKIVGPTITTIPLRTRVDPYELTGDFVRRVQRQAIATMQYEHFGLQHISRISPDCQLACSFQTLFAVQEGVGDLRSQEVPNATKLGKATMLPGYALETYALTLEVFPMDWGFGLRAWFDSRSVDQWKLRAMLCQFGDVARQLATDAPGRRVCDLETLQGRDWETLRDWHSQQQQQQHKHWIVFPDDPQRLTPMGAVGELLIEETEATAGNPPPLPHPDAEAVDRPEWLETPAATGRLWRSGSLVCYEENGNLTTVGRKDTRFLIRGRWVDGGQIERVLGMLIPAGTQVAVEAISLRPEQGKEASSAATTSLAVFLCRTGHGPAQQSETMAAQWSSESESIEAFLSSRLPEFMVPSLYFDVNAMPCTASGRVDRGQLRAVGHSFTTADAARFRATRNKRIPTTEMQSLLQELWATVTKADKSTIGLDDRFFDVGGDSIAAIKLVTEARKRGVALSVADTFRFPKLEDLARFVVTSALNGDEENADVPFSLVGHAVKDDDDGSVEGFLEEHVVPKMPFGREAVEDVLPATYMQKDFFYESNGLIYYNNLDFGTAHMDVQRLRTAVAQLVERHSILRTVFVPSGARDDLLQVILRPGSFDLFTVAQPLGQEGDNLDLAAERLIAADKAESNIVGMPMPRFVFLSYEADGMMRSRIVILRISHMQFDGFSWQFIIKDLAALYAAATPAAAPVNGNGSIIPRSLPPAPQFSSYQYAHHSISAMERRKYWTRLLKGASMTQVIRAAETKRPAQSKHHPDVTYATRTIPKSIWARCLSHPQGPSSVGAKVQRFSPDDVLITTWALALAIVSGEMDVVFGHTVAGRRGISLGGGGADHVLGPCINSAARRVRLDHGDEEKNEQDANAAGQKMTELGLRRAMTLRDLLAKVSEESMRAIPFESTGLDEIVELYAPSLGKVGRWPSTVVWQDFAGMQAAEGSVEAVDEATAAAAAVVAGAEDRNGLVSKDFVASGYLSPFAASSLVDFAGATCTVTCEVPDFIPSELAVVARPLDGDGSVSLSLGYVSGRMPATVVEETAEVMERMLAALADQPTLPVRDLLKRERRHKPLLPVAC